MKAQRKNPEDFTNLSVRVPQELHVRVQQEMLARDGTINFTQLVLGFFERYVAAEEAESHASSVAPQNSTFLGGAGGHKPTPYDLLLEFLPEDARNFGKSMASMVERERERLKLEPKLATKQDPGSGKTFTDRKAKCT